MAVFILPPPRRARLHAFALVQSVCVGVLVTLLARAAGMRYYVLPGIILGLLMILYGMGRPQATERLYRLWTRWAEYYGRWAKGYVLRICYNVVLTPVASIGSRMTGEGGDSMWVPRPTLSPLTYGSQYDLAYPGCSLRHFVISYPAWAYKSGNLWALGLLPFLLLIAALDHEKKESYSGHIYTLF